jgi:LuxR family quorum sensing-dependent transcriptional regulator
VTLILPAKKDSPPIEQLTECERDVLQLAADGLTAKEIAAHRVRSFHTVAMQIATARGKLGASNTAHAIAIAIRKGVIH